MSSKDTTMIPISVALREELKRMGNKGDTYDDIVWVLIHKVVKNERESTDE